MEQLTVFLRVFATVVLFSLLLLNPGSARCESPTGGLSKAQSQARMNGSSRVMADDPDLREEKSQRFQEMEWLIKQYLMKKYERMEVMQGLEDNLD